MWKTRLNFTAKERMQTVVFLSPRYARQPLKSWITPKPWDISPTYRSRFILFCFNICRARLSYHWKYVMTPVLVFLFNFENVICYPLIWFVSPSELLLDAFSASVGEAYDCFLLLKQNWLFFFQCIKMFVDILIHTIFI